MKGNAGIGQGTSNLGVAGKGGWLVVVVGKNSLGLYVFGQIRYFFDSIAVQHNEPHLSSQLGGNACLGGGLAQQVVHFKQGFLDESNPPIFAGQWVQDVGVKDKYTLHFVAVFEGMVQGGVVVNA
jgi:hypothetical protein